MGWVLVLEPDIEEAVRFTMATFGCDPNEGTFSAKEARVPRILALRAGCRSLVAGTALWGLWKSPSQGLFSRSVSTTDLVKWESI